MQNAFANRSNADLVSVGAQALSAITAGGGSYGTTTAQDTALDDATTALESALTATAAARAASKSATQSEESARADILAALSSIGVTIYNNADVTNQMIADAGYAVHDTTPTKHFPAQVTDLAASPDSTGRVLFTWNKKENVYGTIYSIEGRPDESSAWVPVANTKRTRITVSGFTPGETYYFRVRAWNNGQASDPSAVTGIWLPSQEATLQVAA